MTADGSPRLPRSLCRLADIPDGGARGFGPALGGFTGLFAVRRGRQAFVYVNACPHVGASLDAMPGRFLAADGGAIGAACMGRGSGSRMGFALPGHASVRRWRRCR